MSQLSRHSTASEGMPPHFQKTVESNPCTQSLPACFELRSTARAAKSAEWPANQAGRREQGVAGLLGVGQVLRLHGGRVHGGRVQMGLLRELSPGPLAP